jgi:hypothetical protein
MGNKINNLIKNRPSIASSKIQPKMKEIKLGKKKISRDPRFDPLVLSNSTTQKVNYTSYNPYSFLDDLREKEVEDLKLKYRDKENDDKQRKEIQKEISKLVKKKN